MKTWYGASHYAVCQEHGEAIDIFVSNPGCTAAYLSEHDAEIQCWLEDHIGCDLLMIGNDLQKEKYIYDPGWKLVPQPGSHFRLWKRPFLQLS